MRIAEKREKKSRGTLRVSGIRIPETRNVPRDFFSRFSAMRMVRWPFLLSNQIVATALRQRTVPADF